MKKITLLLLLSLPLIAASQTITPRQTGTNGVSDNNLRVLSTFSIPAASTPPASTFYQAGSVRYNTVTSKLEIYNGSIWVSQLNLIGGAINWPSSLYTTPTAATTPSGILTFAPALATQTARTMLGNHTGSTATPTFAVLSLADMPSGVGLTASSLAQFAATTSSQLRSILSDESGTGVALFQNGDLGTPTAGVATNLTGTAGALNIGGNAATATALQTARSIQGISFNGTSNIDPINGTGFVKSTGTTLSYDNSTYLTTSAAGSTYLPLTGGEVAGILTGYANMGITSLPSSFYNTASSKWMIGNNRSNGSGEVDYFSAPGNGGVAFGGHRWYTVTSAGLAFQQMDLNGSTAALTVQGPVVATHNTASGTDNILVLSGSPANEIKKRSLADFKSDLAMPISGSYSTTATAQTTFTVTIGTTQANTTYKVNATPTSLLAAAVFYVTNKTTTTFDVVYLTGITGAVAFDWSVFP